MATNPALRLSTPITSSAPTKSQPAPPPEIPNPGPVTQLGERIFLLIQELGAILLFVQQVMFWLVWKKPSSKTMLPAMYEIGVRSVPVVAVTGTFIGMVLAAQAYASFHLMNLENRLGSVINRSLVNELGPVLAATMLAGRVGSAMAAEIGTMKVTEQIDALRCLGMNPIHFLVVPRLIACVLLIPLLTVMADFMGVIGGAVISIRIYHIDSYYYWLYSRTSVGLWAIFTGLLKSIVFGALIALISCDRGFRSAGGAEGVGKAATEAFVYSFIAILASDFFLGLWFNQIYFIIWPETGAGFSQ